MNPVDLTYINEMKAYLDAQEESSLEEPQDLDLRLEDEVRVESITSMEMSPAAGAVFTTTGGERINIDFAKYLKGGSAQGSYMDMGALDPEIGKDVAEEEPDFEEVAPSKSNENAPLNRGRRNLPQNGVTENRRRRVGRTG